MNFLTSLYEGIHKYKLHLVFGLFLVVVSVVTWWMDYAGLVDPCIYCRTERTMLGVVGLVLLLDKTVLHFLVSIYATLFGAYVSLAQVFLHLRTGVFPNGEYTVLAIGSTYLFIAAGVIIISRCFYHHRDGLNK